MATQIKLPQISAGSQSRKKMAVETETESIIRSLRNEPLTIQSTKSQRPFSRLYKVPTQSTQSKFRNTNFLSPQSTRSVYKKPQTKVVNDILRESQIFFRNKEMTQTIQNMQTMNLLKNYDTSVKKFKPNERIKYVLNDYHSRATNNGYSRNIIGGYFFTK